MEESSSEQLSPSKPSRVTLVTDLDGTLLDGDLLWECLLRYLLPRPWRIFSVLFWIAKGGPSLLKFHLSELVSFNEKGLPWNKSVLDHCLSASGNGPVAIATASNEKLARHSVRQFTFFSRILGSSKERNLKGSTKASCLMADFPEGFDYIGDSRADIAVWKASRNAIFIGSNKRRKKFEAILERPFSKHIERGSVHPKYWVKLLRPHQWIKNALVFLPLLAAHRWNEPDLILDIGLAFAAFSLIASSVYIINDLLDLDSDRNHPLKRHRPIASGQVSIRDGLILAAVLLGGGVVFSALLGIQFLGIMSLYFGLTMAYSLRLKKSAPLDAVLLASFYTLRIIAGGVAVSIFPSTWLLVFSSTFFFSLALVKRISELIGVENAVFSRRGYRSDDRLAVMSLGTGSGLVSVLVVALYVSSPDALPLYHRPELLLLICPILIYWISRLWLLACRGEIHLDPVVFACKDRTSWICGFAIALILALACR